MAKLGVSELPKPLNWFSKFGMDNYVCNITQQAKIQTDCPVAESRQIGEISLSHGFWFSYFCDPKFCSHPKTKPENRFLHFLICNIPREIKLQKNPILPFLLQNTPHKWCEYALSSLMLKILKVAYYQNYWTDSNQILHSDKDQQILFVSSIQTGVQQIQNCGWPPSWKFKKGHLKF